MKSKMNRLLFKMKLKYSNNNHNKYNNNSYNNNQINYNLMYLFMK